MLINHRTAQLGVVNQKRPEVWQSHIIPQLQSEDTVKLNLTAGDVKLLTVAKDFRFDEDRVGVAISVGNNRLIDTVKTVSIDEDLVKVNLIPGNHRVIDSVKTRREDTDIGIVGLSVGNHRISIWGIRAEVLHEDNIAVGLGISDHKLYKE